MSTLVGPQCANVSTSPGPTAWPARPGCHFCIPTFHGLRSLHQTRQGATSSAHDDLFGAVVVCPCYILAYRPCAAKTAQQSRQAKALPTLQMPPGSASREPTDPTLSYICVDMLDGLLQHNVYCNVPELEGHEWFHETAGCMQAALHAISDRT